MNKVKEANDSRLSARVIPEDKTVKAEFTPVDHANGELWLQIGWKDSQGNSIGPIAELIAPISEQWANARWNELHAERDALVAALKDLCGFLSVTEGDSVTLSMLIDAARAALALVEKENDEG